MTERRDTSRDVLKPFLMGAASGTMATFIFQPFDVVKTRLQNEKTAKRGQGIRDVTKALFKTEGITGFWRGLTPSLVRTVPGIGAHFCMLHYLTVNFSTEGNPSAAQAVSFGFLSRTVADMIVFPVIVVKTRFESGLFNYKHIIDALTQIKKVEGTRGLYKGYVPTIMRDSPFSGLYYLFYTQSKALVESSSIASEMYTTNVHFACGLVAGSAAAFATHPFDVIKTKMQTSTSRRSFGSVVVYLFKTRGIRGFYLGLVPRMMRRTLMAAVSWASFEKLLLVFNGSA